ncbi:MAG: SlyX family protein [Xanthomonadales bacterium]|nr:SlyX family protein [Xanthomonadales bacterium]
MGESLSELIRRIDELESQLAFQDELHENLNNIVARQDRELIDLKRQLALLSERIKEVGEGIPGLGPQDETPPHY